MLNLNARWVVSTFLFASLSAGGQVLADESFQPAGRWVLVNDWGGTFELALFDITKSSDGFKTTVIDARPNMGSLKLKSFECDGGHVSLAFRERAGEIRFEGRMKDADNHAGELLGTVERGAYIDPARLVRVDAEKLEPDRSPPFEGYRDRLEAIWKLKELKQRAEAWAEIVRKAPGPGTNYELRLWLISATDAGAKESQIRQQLEAWFIAAEPYGPKFVAEARLVAIRSLRGQPKFAHVSLEIAEQARENLSDFRSLDDQSSLLHFLAGAAKLAGKEDMAADAERQATDIDARLDADYDARVPPFQAEAYAGRKYPGDDRVVLLELFTGAMCPPCLAADIACDAIGSAFQASEVVLMQYHLHIPGKDPLANPDATARSEYYGFRGVPTAFFNGDPSPSGGGPLELAEERYREFRQRVEAQLAGKREAAIQLRVTRAADTLVIRSTAEAVRSQANDVQSAEDKKSEPNLRLRIALTENLVRYDGGNGVRINRHVVRDFPGGLEGKRLVSGRAEVQLEVDLAALRRDLQDYLQEKAGAISLACPRPLPPLELKQLAVVAFVQDDDSKRVLHAVQVAVPED